MREQHFNLVDEPWIRVLDNSGHTLDVSLRDIFHRASDIVAISGELPTLDVAILRILLAVLHRAVEGPLDIEEWAEFRDDWPGVMAKVDAYLDRHKDRFWMQHPTQPFMQVADLKRAGKEKESSLIKFVVDGTGSENKPSQFSTRTVPDSISWSEAARWLVHCHSFDIAGIHSGAIGDPRVTGGKGPGIGTGWLGQQGTVFIVGETLKDTLILNLVVPDVAGLHSSVNDIPVWERPALTALPETWPDDGQKHDRYRDPEGLVDLYTWPSRRIRLFGDEFRVSDVLVSQGDRAQRGRVPPTNWFRIEPMTGWKLSSNKTKETQGLPVYYPVDFSSARSFWRGLEALLPQPSSTGQDGISKIVPPALSRWVSALRTEGQFAEALVRWHAVGIEYGSNDSSYNELISDEIVLPTAVFTSEELADQVLRAADVADKAVFALGTLAQNVALAAGGSSESSGHRTKNVAQGFAALDPLFRNWVRTLGEGKTMVEARKDWHRTVHREVSNIGYQIIEEAGLAAYVGRTSGGQFRDAGLALRWFKNALRKALPYAFAIEESDEEGMDEK